MKKKLSILLITCASLVLRAYAQDSIRTRNDKPGTPQSLRKINTAPKNEHHIINANVAPNQTVNHGATESNNVNNKQEQIIVSDPNNDKVNSKNPVITGRADSINSTIIHKRKSNVTNPIRK